MWLFTFLGKVEGKFGEPKEGEAREEEALIRVAHSYSELLWLKYPGMCPVCYRRRSQGGDRSHETSESFTSHCDCLLYDVESRDQTQKRTHVQALRGFAQDNVASKPSSVDAFQRMFASIFLPNLRHLDLDDIAFHLLEEMGEVSDAMVRTYTYLGALEPGEPYWRQVWLEEEIADVTSWLFALVEKLNLIRVTADEYDKYRFRNTVTQRDPFFLSQIIWRRYGSDDLKDFYCPIGDTGQAKTCDCPIILVPHDLSVEELRAVFSSPT